MTLFFLLGMICLTATFFWYRKWHYETANAFYLSYKNEAPFYKQQQAFMKSINPELMKKLELTFTTQEKSSILYAVTTIENDKEYTFFPNMESGEVNVAIYKKGTSENLCSFALNKKMKSKFGASGTDKKNFDYYEDEAVRIYKDIFKAVYENWEIQ